MLLSKCAVYNSEKVNFIRQKKTKRLLNKLAEIKYQL